MLRRRMLALAGAAAALSPWRATGQPRRIDLAGFRPTFAAEFDRPGPLSVRDGGRFTTRFEQWGGLRTLPGTGELELYVDSAFIPAAGGTDKDGHADAPPGSAPPLGYNPFAFRGGCLEIAAVPVPTQSHGRVDRPYLSGLISTEWSFAQRYGYFEIRASLPPGRGLWPAFWMVSNTAAEHVEIDVFEAIGEGNAIYHSIHNSPARGKSVHLKHALDFDYAAGLHDYGVLWTPDAVVFFVDGIETARADGAPLRDAPPMYLIACMALGGTWPGTPPPATPFPAILRIAHIRAYQAL